MQTPWQREMGWIQCPEATCTSPRNTYLSKTGHSLFFKIMNNVWTLDGLLRTNFCFIKRVECSVKLVQYVEQRSVFWIYVYVRENRNRQERTSNQMLQSQVPSQAEVKYTFQSRPERCIAVKKGEKRTLHPCVKVISAGSKVDCCLALSDEEETVFGAEFLNPLGSRHVFALTALPLRAGPCQKHL